MPLLPLSTIAHGRSGDKGNHSNIAIIAYQPDGYCWLCDHLTAERVADFFRSVGLSSVERFLVPNLNALNFLLRDALAGGASESLRIDTQGKTFAMVLLGMQVDLPEAYQTMLREVSP
jgi:hypothetical protein